MNRQKWLKRAGLVLLALVAAHFAVNAALQTSRVRRAFTARLETAFGRQVEVGRIDLSLFPRPRLEAREVSVGEDPAFGFEYFLRAERVTAGLRWSGLLRGRIEFGAFSFTRPSLNLVRDAAGRWNLDRWLPPALRDADATGTKAAASRDRAFGPAPPAAMPVRLDRVEFDEGRINFKNGEEKLSFAFTGVSGKVEQIAPGRWTLQLEAQPWRSGTLLQVAGQILVRGDLAGTSARLQPAEIHIHWGEASLADLMRLARGQDYGLRGDVTVDAVARSGGAGAGTPPARSSSGEWTFRVEARARQIHRWDLTERRDNPAVNVLLEGSWNLAAGEARIARVAVEAPHSNARGEAVFALSAPSSFELRIDSAGIQAADLLAWYRGFHSGVAEETSAEGFLTGAATLTGWPLAVQNAAFSSSGGVLRVAGLAKPVRIGAFEGGRTRSRFTLEPAWITLGANPPRPLTAGSKKSASARGRSRPVEGPANAVLAAATYEIETGSGTLSLDGQVDRAEDVLAIAAALGKPLERGWKGKGSASGSLHWSWQGSPWSAHLSGHVDLAKGELQVAGLNLPLALNDAQLIWNDGRHAAHMGSVQGFGAQWSGEIEEAGQVSSDDPPGWKFRLHADHLDAAELDRWTGPRARPGWLERLLPSLLGGAAQGANANASASELIRRIRAEGEIGVDSLSIGKLSLTQMKATVSLRDLRLAVLEATAEYAGGTVRGTMQSEFKPRPRYVVDARMEKIQLADLLAPERIPRGQSGHWEGVASGQIHLATEGVGREELLRELEGGGRIQLRNVSLHGWDVRASFGKGALQSGASRWPAGDGDFNIRQGAFLFDPLRLGSGPEKIELRGTVNFARSAELEIAPSGKGTGPARVMKINGPMDAPTVSVEPRKQGSREK
jgi:hypothetical protein